MNVWREQRHFWITNVLSNDSEVRTPESGHHHEVMTQHSSLSLLRVLLFWDSERERRWDDMHLICISVWDRGWMCGWGGWMSEQIVRMSVNKLSPSQCLSLTMLHIHEHWGEFIYLGTQETFFLIPITWVIIQLFSYFVTSSLLYYLKILPCFPACHYFPTHHTPWLILPSTPPTHPNKLAPLVRKKYHCIASLRMPRDGTKGCLVLNAKITQPCTCIYANL